MTGPSGERPAAAHDALPALVAERIAGSVPFNTRRCWGSRWRRYEQWCVQHGHTPLPATSALLTGFLVHLDEEGLKAASLDTYLGSLMAVIRLWTQAESERRARARLLAPSIGLCSGPEHDPVLPDTSAARQFVRERLQRVASHPTDTVRHASALYAPEIRAIVDAMRPSSRTFLRDRALILLAFALGRRGAQVAGIDLEELGESADGAGPVVWLPGGGHSRRTGRRDRVEIPVSADPRYCPVAAVHAWRAALAAHGLVSGPLFPRTDQGGRIGTDARGRARQRSHDDGRITPETLYNVVRRHAVAAGLSAPDGDAAPRKITAHSLRRGFVVTAFERGADPVTVARHAGFTETSSTLPRYVEPGTGWNHNPASGLLDGP